MKTTNLTPTTNAPGIGDRRTLRFTLEDEAGDAAALTKSLATVLEKRPRSLATDVTASTVQDGNDLTLVRDLDVDGLWRYRVIFDDSAGSGFVEAREYRLEVLGRSVEAV